MSINVDLLQDLLRREDFASAFAMLDEARRSAETPEERKSEIFWRSFCLVKQKRHEEALGLLRDNTQLFSSQSHVKHEIARVLVLQGSHQEALKELGGAPIDFELKSFYALAIDAKFLYLHLLAKEGDPTILDHLSEIPDNYRYICPDGKILSKSDIIPLQSRAASETP